MKTRLKIRPAVGSNFFLYLAAATACQGMFALGYWLLLAQLSTFTWNRAYLLGALVLSVVLPLVALPAAWAQWLWPAALPAAATLPVWHLAAATLAPATTAAAPAGVSWLSAALVVTTCHLTPTPSLYIFLYGLQARNRQCCPTL